MLGITSSLFLKFKKKFCSLPKIVTGLHICHLMLKIDLVGKLRSILISPFSLYGINQIQRTAQTIFLFWNLLYQILLEVDALVAVVQKPLSQSSYGHLFLHWDLAGILRPLWTSIFSSSLISIWAFAFPIIQVWFLLYTSVTRLAATNPSLGLSLQQSSQPCPGLEITQRPLKPWSAGPTLFIWVSSYILLTSSQMILMGSPLWELELWISSGTQEAAMPPWLWYLFPVNHGNTIYLLAQ